MLCKIAPSLLLLSASLVAANAQSANGTYRGQVQLTKDVEHVSGADACTATGRAIEFRVTGATVFLHHPRSGQVFSGPLSGDGTFQISFLHRAGAGQSGKWIVADFKGTVSGSRIAGNAVGIGPGRDCYHAFTARKAGGK